MRGRGVDDAGAGVHSDIVGKYAENFAVEEWMLEVETLELAAGEMSEFTRVGEATLLGCIFGQFRGNDIDLATGFQRHVFFVRMKSDRHRSGQSPGSSRPDDGENFLAGERGVNARGIVEQSVLHPDG